MKALHICRAARLDYKGLNVTASRPKLKGQPYLRGQGQIKVSKLKTSKTIIGFLFDYSKSFRTLQAARLQMSQNISRNSIFRKFIKILRKVKRFNIINYLHFMCD
jgi:hypothetical protein